MTLTQKLFTGVALGAFAYWMITPDAKVETPPTQAKHLEVESQKDSSKIQAPSQKELLDLQEAHLGQLDPEQPFLVEYSYGQDEVLSEKEVANYESQRVLQDRWEEIRAFNDGELPHLTEVDKAIAVELMREEGLTSVYENP